MRVNLLFFVISMHKLQVMWDKFKRIKTLTFFFGLERSALSFRINNYFVTFVVETTLMHTTAIICD